MSERSVLVQKLGSIDSHVGGLVGTSARSWGRWRVVESLNRELILS